jgi:hypothetical protein
MVQAVIPTTVTGLQGLPISAPLNPTANQALIWNGTAWVPGGPYAPLSQFITAPYIPQNYIDNSGFSVNQRAYASGGALTGGAYGFDRWKAGPSGCTLTYSATPASTVVTIASGALVQVVEGLNLLSGQYVLTWSGSSVCSVNGGTSAPSPIQITATAGANMTLSWSGGTLAQVQLQLGTTATPWQPQPAQVELARCQRFFQLSGLGISDYLQAGVGTLRYAWLLVQMRATPTLGATPGGVTNISIDGYSAQVQSWLTSFHGVTTGLGTVSITATLSADL